MKIGKYRVTSAFTIVELLVVIVVIGVLVSITVVSYSGITNRAVIANAQSDLSNASKKLKIYQLNNQDENYPIDKATAIAAKLIPDDTNYSYYVDNTTNPKTFCISYINQDSNIAYSINQDGSPIPAPYCPFLYLDASNPNSYPGSGTTWYDLSGLSNNATLTNGPTFTPDSGGAFSFDGVNDYARATGNSINAGSWDYEVATFSIWIKPSSTAPTTDQNIITIETAFEIAINNRDNGFSSVKYASVPWAWRGIVSNDITNDTWNNLVYVHTLYNRKIYVNGNVVFTSSDTGGLWLGTATYPYMTIGARYSGTTANTLGQINDVRVYGRALSSDEVLQNFNNTKGRYGI